MKRYISILLTGIIALQPLTTIAAESNSSDVLLTTTPQIFSAIVPTELPVYMDKLGVITTAEDTIITNTSKGPIIVHDIAVEVKDSSWSMAHFTDDFTKFKVNSNILGLQFNGDNVTSSGTTELNPVHWSAINGLESMELNYDAKLAAQSGVLTDVRPVKVVFTLKWHEAGKADMVGQTDTLMVGDNKLLTFSFANIVAENNLVIWSSSDESVATVKDYVGKGRVAFSGSKECEITAICVGTATITGTLKDGTSASMNVVVTEKVEDIDVGTKYSEGSYEYSYGQMDNVSGTSWQTVPEQQGWGVRLRHPNSYQTDYESPLTTIQGHPVTNMSYLFHNKSMSTLNLIDWDTSNVTDMPHMFSSSQATSLDLSSFDTSKVTNMEDMFSNSEARNLDLSSFDTSNVTSMYQMFFRSRATSLDLRNFETSKVTDMRGMFWDSAATSLDLSSFNTKNTTNMHGMFYGSQATSLDLSNFEASNATNMHEMFRKSAATIVDLSNFDTSNANIFHMFRDVPLKILKARTQADIDRYKLSGNFHSETITSETPSTYA